MSSLSNLWGREIIAGTGLQGGGNLSSNVTLSIDSSALEGVLKNDESFHDFKISYSNANGDTSGLIITTDVPQNTSSSNYEDTATILLDYKSEASSWNAIKVIDGKYSRQRFTVKQNGNVDIGGDLQIDGKVNIDNNNDDSPLQLNAMNDKTFLSFNDDLARFQRGGFENALELYLDQSFQIKNANGQLFFWGSTVECYKDLNVNGRITKNSGSFKIDHPLSELNKTHHLVHSFVEAPFMDLIYSGMVTLGEEGKATVNIDDASTMTHGTFEALTCNQRFFVTNQSGWTPVKSQLIGNNLTILAKDSTCRDNVYWQVIGERCDQHTKEASWTDSNGRVIVEPLKRNSNNG